MNGVTDSCEQPALKIPEFFRGITITQARAASVNNATMEAGGVPQYATGKLQQYSPSFGALEPLGEAHARAWVAYWKKQGFLDM